ncbi:hypothetical protein AAF712_009522 [Marasmius tenuissimus]|uniref:Uncharacterized protein n=1 Tax=Marasmius tenuissimus TaxID=585030 RepID=A0ABR2ZPE1_9AGAR
MSEVEKRIAEWSKEKEELGKEEQDWKLRRDGRAEERKKQKEADEEEVQRKTIPEPQVKPEPFTFSFSDTDIESLDRDWETLYPLLTSHQQMVFQAGFAAGRSRKRRPEERRAVVERERQGEGEHGLDHGSGGSGYRSLELDSLWNLYQKKRGMPKNEKAHPNKKSGGGNNTCFRCRIKKGKCSLTGPGGVARSEAGSVATEKTRGSEGERKGSVKQMGIILSPETEKNLRQINRGIQLMLAHWGVDFPESSDDEEQDDEPEPEPEDEEDRGEGPSTRPNKRLASQSPRNVRKKVKSAETVPEDSDAEDEDEDKMKE